MTHSITVRSCIRAQIYRPVTHALSAYSADDDQSAGRQAKVKSRLTPLGEMDLLLVLALRNGVGLLVGKTSTDGTGLLVSEVEGEVCCRDAK